MMNDNQTAAKGNASGNPLGYAPIMGLIRKFAIPSIISMLVSAAYNITDQIFIGHVVGMLGNAATNVAFPVVTFTIAFAQLAGVGTAANFNISLGAKREEEAKKYLGYGIDIDGHSWNFDDGYRFGFKNANSAPVRSDGKCPSLCPALSGNHSLWFAIFIIYQRGKYHYSC